MPGTRKLPCPVDEPSEGVLLNVKLRELVGLGVTVRGSVSWPFEGPSQYSALYGPAWRGTTSWDICCDSDLR